MSVDQEKLRSSQTVEYGRYIDYIQHADAPLPEKETKTTMPYYSVQDGLLFISYLPGYLRKRSTFREKLVVPLVGLILHAYHDHVLTGGHLAFRPTYDKIRQKYWWPTISRDVRDGAKNAKLVNDEKQHTTDPNSRQAIYLSSGHFNEYRLT